MVMYARGIIAFAFFVSAIKEFNECSMGPFTDVVSAILSCYAQTKILPTEVKHVILTVKAAAAILFLSDHPFGPFLLLLVQVISTFVPFPTDFHDFSQNLTLALALLFHLEMKNEINSLRSQKKISDKPKSEN